VTHNSLLKRQDSATMMDLRAAAESGYTGQKLLGLLREHRDLTVDDDWGQGIMLRGTAKSITLAEPLSISSTSERKRAFSSSHTQSWGSNRRETERDTHENEKKKGQLGKEVGQRE